MRGSAHAGPSLLQVPEEMAGPLLLPNEDRPQPSPDVGTLHVETMDVLLRADSEVGRPASKVDVDLLDASRWRLAPHPRR